MECVQEDINVGMRCILIDWLVEVTQVRCDPSLPAQWRPLSRSFPAPPLVGLTSGAAT